MNYDAIRVIDNLLPEKVLNEVIAEAENSHFYYPFHQAGDGSQGFKFSWHFYYPEANIQFLNEKIKALWEEIKSYLPENHKLRRGYINAHQYGIEDTIHSDDDQWENGLTVIVYLCSGWLPDWHGQTMFFTGEDRNNLQSSMDIYKCVLPKFNRFLIFDKNIKHCAGMVSRRFSGIRLTCMFKVELTNEN